jgi:thiamine-phosphate pyrophosphorylase
MERVPRLLVITPPEPDSVPLRAVLPDLAESVDAVLLRWPGLPGRAYVARARELTAISPRPLLLVSDRLDVALAAGADGVHLRDDGLPPARVRRVAPDLVVGVSRHDLAGLARAAGADYATLSPVYATSSKLGAPPLGLEVLERACAASPVPVVALGGIDAPRAAECRARGAWGVAVLSAVWRPEDPVAAARGIRRAAEGPTGSTGRI